MKALSLTVVALAALCLVAPLGAAKMKQTYAFALDEWHEIDSVDGPVTLHRIRLNPKESRITRSSMLRPFNQEYLSTVRIQLEFTNEADRSWRARVAVRWLDNDGTIIDGFSGNEKLEKKSARKITEMSIPTLRYGLDVAERLEVEINYEP